MQPLHPLLVAVIVRVDIHQPLQACDSLERLVDIDPYDHRNQQGMERLHRGVDDAFLKRVGAKLSKSGTAAPPRSVQTRSPSTEGGRTAAAEGGGGRRLEGGGEGTWQ